MLSVLTYASGRTLKRPVDMDVFMPHYLDAPKKTVNKSLEQQRDEFAAFAAKLKAVQGKR